MYYSVILFAVIHLKMLLTVIASVRYENVQLLVFLHVSVQDSMAIFSELQPSTELGLLFLVKEITPIKQISSSCLVAYAKLAGDLRPNPSGMASVHITRSSTNCPLFGILYIKSKEKMDSVD